MAHQGVSAICQTFLYRLELFSYTDFTPGSVPLSATMANQSLTYSQEKEELCNVGQTLWKHIIALLSKGKKL